MRAVAIGSFDGIHLGHEAVILTALSIDQGAEVICFEPVPRQFFGYRDWARRLTTPGERRKALSDLGVKASITVPFDGETVGLSPEAFLDGLELGSGPYAIVAGYDFHFGSERSGNCDILRKWCTCMGFDAIIEPPLEIGGEPVKSERIRGLLEKGALEECQRLLGRMYSVSGAVSRGKGLGRKLGFPTLNLRVPRGKMLPPPGSYAGWVELEGEGKGIPSAIFVPGHATGPVEAHLLRPVEDAYGRSATVSFRKRLRSVAETDDTGELQRLIAGDAASALSHLGACKYDERDGAERTESRK